MGRPIYHRQLFEVTCMVRCRLAGATVALLLFATVVSAQTSVGGRAVKAQGGAVPNATATLRALPAPGAPVMPNMPNMPGMAGMERTATAGADGAFSFDQVAAGQY